MHKIPRLALQRIALYLGVSVVGMTGLLGAYCLVSGRSPAQVLQNLWIALLFAGIASIATALRDHRQESRPGSNGSATGDDDHADG